MSEILLYVLLVFFGVYVGILLMSLLAMARNPDDEM